MAVIVANQRLSLARNGSISTVRVPIDPLTSHLLLTISRETAGGSVVFPSASRLSTNLILRAGTADYRTSGFSVGGINPESGVYSLGWGLQTGFFNSDVVRRLGEAVSTFDLMIELMLDGEAINTNWSLEAFQAVKPEWTRHHSVAFDTSSFAVEVGGDGILSLSHTAAGTDRAAFVGNSWGQDANITTSTATYAGNAMTEHWDAEPIGAGFGGAGYTLAGDANIPASSQTVTSTLSAAHTRHHLGVITVNGVDSGTPVGSPATSTTASATPSVTATSLTTDGLICDCVSYTSSPAATSTEGANQTERVDQVSNLTSIAMSTQSSNDGGVMSWTLSQLPFVLVHGAIEFKPAAAASVGHGNLLLLGVG